MTALQLARAECPNLESDVCMGINIHDDLTLSKSAGAPACLLGGKERCKYFETTIAPMAEYQTDTRKAQSYQDAVFSYRSKHPQMNGSTRGCPDCGTPIFKQDRYCPSCAKERRKKSFAKANILRRTTNAVSLTTVS